LHTMSPSCVPESDWSDVEPPLTHTVVHGELGVTRRADARVTVRRRSMNLVLKNGKAISAKR
jgi:hypothetical protein